MEKALYISKEKIKYYLMVFLKKVNMLMVYYIMMMEVKNVKVIFLIIQKYILIYSLMEILMKNMKGISKTVILMDMESFI